MTERLYHLAAINERQGRKVYLTDHPLVHHLCVVLKSKFVPHRDVRIQLEPA
jgi:hypothetical protein